MNRVVIDFGSDTVKAGFGGDDAPRSVFPNVIGRTKYPALMVGARYLDAWAGDECMAKRGCLRVTHPRLETMNNWDDFEKIIHHLFYNELRVAPEEHDVLMVDKLFSPSAEKEKQLQIMMETFCVPAFGLMPSNVLIPYAAGRTTGVSVDIGDSSIAIAPIYEGYLIRSGCSRLDFGGRHVTQFLYKMMQSRIQYSGATAHEIVREIKEKHSYVALDYEVEKSQHHAVDYVLPDERILRVDNERFHCMESFFNGSIGDMSQHVTLQHLIFKSIMKSDIDTRADLKRNIMLAGGPTMCVNFPERLTKELSKFQWQPTVVAPSERKYSAWIGASILASLGKFPPACMVSKQEYDESGPSIVHRKCVVL